MPWEPRRRKCAAITCEVLWIDARVSRTRAEPGHGWGIRTGLRSRRFRPQVELPPRLFRPTIRCLSRNRAAADGDAAARGLWPMMRPGAVSGATRALWCLWHEVRVDERTVR
eukprot:2201390-Prymnesium_polylepis.2